MIHKTQKQSTNFSETHLTPNSPFNTKHLVKYKRELKRAGDFNALMLKKQALQTKDAMTFIALHHDIEDYKLKFLRGGYATLRPHYNTEVPYVFWSKLHLMLINSGMLKQ